jgi:hypothetical protein
VLCCSKNSELRSCAVIRNDIPDETSGLRKLIIAAMLMKKDDSAVLAAQLVAAYGHAKAGSYILKVLAAICAEQLRPMASILEKSCE